MSECRESCTQWRRGAYVASILSEADNHALRRKVGARTFVLLGAQRRSQTSTSASDAMHFRWTEGPFGLHDGGKGRLLWTANNVTFTGGRCATGSFCAFDTDEPSDGGERYVLMRNSAGKWLDATCWGVPYCACRLDEFGIVPAPPNLTRGERNASMCRAPCAQWAPGAYPAAVLNSDENELVFRICPEGSTVGLGGDVTAVFGNNTLEQSARWTEGPLHASSSSMNATMLWRSTIRYGNISTQEEICFGYCNFSNRMWFIGSQRPTQIAMRCAPSTTMSWESMDWLYRGTETLCACRLPDGMFSTTYSSSAARASLSASYSESFVGQSRSTTSTSSISLQGTMSHSLLSRTGSPIVYSSTLSRSNSATQVDSISISLSLSLTTTQSVTTASSFTASQRSGSLSYSPTPTSSGTHSYSYRCAIDECSTVGVLWSSGGETSSWPAEVDSTPASLTARAAAPYDVAASGGQQLGVSLRCGAYPIPLDPREVSLLEPDGSAAPLSVSEIQPRGVRHTLRLLLVLGNASRPNGWLPSVVFPYRTGNRIRVGLSIACDGRRSVVVVVPVDPLPQPALVVVAGQASGGMQWTSALAAASSASVVGRVGAVRGVVLCSSVGASSGGLLGLSLPREGDADGGTAGYARGAVIGNLCVLVCGACVLAVVGGVYAAFARQPLREALLRVALPSSLLPVWVATVQSTAAVVPLLLASSPVSAADALLAAVGAVVLLLAPLCFLIAVPMIVEWCGGECCEAPLSIGATDSKSSTAARLVARWLRRQRRWQSRNSDPALRCVWYVLCDYNVLLFGAVDAGVLMLSAAAASASGLGSVACRAVGVVTLLLYVGELALCAALRPFAVPAMNVFTVVTLSLTSAGLLLQLVAVFASSREGGRLPPMLVDVSSVAMLAVLGITAMKLIVDGALMCRACGRLVREAARLRRVGVVVRDNDRVDVKMPAQWDGEEANTALEFALATPTQECGVVFAQDAFGGFSKLCPVEPECSSYDVMMAQFSSCRSTEGESGSGGEDAATLLMLQEVREDSDYNPAQSTRRRSVCYDLLDAFELMSNRETRL